MSLFIRDAFAEETPATTTATTTAPAQSGGIMDMGGSHGQGGYGTLIFLGVFFVIFYLLFIRPQSKRAKEHRSMLQNLAVGDEVVTSGGILGKIKKVDDNFFCIEIADNTQIKVQKPAIAASLPKGTIKAE